MLAYKAPVCQKTSEAPINVSACLNNPISTICSLQVHVQLCITSLQFMCEYRWFSDCTVKTLHSILQAFKCRGLRIG